MLMCVTEGQIEDGDLEEATTASEGRGSSKHSGFFAPLMLQYRVRNDYEYDFLGFLVKALFVNESQTVMLVSNDLKLSAHGPFQAAWKSSEKRVTKEARIVFTMA